MTCKDFYKLNLLYEAYIFNKDSLIKQLNSLLDSEEIQADSPIRQWLIQRYTAYYQSNENDERKSLKPYSFKEGDPEWARNKKDIFEVTNFSADEINHLREIIHYLATRPPEYLKGLLKKSWKEVTAATEKWQREMAKAGQDKESLLKNQARLLKQGKDIEFFFESKELPNKVWIRILNDKAGLIFGKILQNCIGTHWKCGPGVDIFILIDKNSYNGHIAIASKNKQIKEIKGKNNESPMPKYIPATASFIKYLIDELGYKVTSDGESIGMMRYQNEFFWPDSKQWKDFYTNTIVPNQQKALNDLFARIQTLNESVKQSTKSLAQIYEQILENTITAPPPTKAPTPAPPRPQTPSQPNRNPLRSPSPGRKSKPKALKPLQDVEFWKRLKQKYNL